MALKYPKERTLEIMDTTLRDGEQMQHVSYSLEEKLTLSKILLTEVKIDRLEITSAKVSEGEKQSVIKIVNWAKEFNLVEHLEILGFVDGQQSVDWAVSTGIKTINLLTKGSYKHCTEQLRKTPEQHLKEITYTIQYAIDKNISINVYLEDFSNGIKDSPDYVHQMIDSLRNLPVKRLMLPDTLGILEPFETYEYLSQLLSQYSDVHFDFHSHNDYGLGTANALAAVRAGIQGIHATINGMGERAGNAPLDEVVIAAKDFLNVKVNINERKLYLASQYVETFSSQRMANNKPIYGKNVFTQTAGIHADGDKKGNLYGNRLAPERFGRKKRYALGKLSGRANLEMSLKELDIELTEEQKQILLQKIIELGDKKEFVTPEDLPYLISDMFETLKTIPFELVSYSINTSYQLRPVATIKCTYYDKVMEAYAQGDGGYNAFMNALRRVLQAFKLPIPQLVDYAVTIPPGGKTDALVQAAISWKIKQRNGETVTVTTRGVSSDQNLAAIESTIKIINMIISQQNH